MSKTCNLFCDEPCNIISDVLAIASGVDPKKLSTGDDFAKATFYEYLAEIPYTSLVAELDDALKQLGYKITLDKCDG